MVGAQYEVRVSGRLSERARSAFSAMQVRDVPTQTIVFGELTGPSGLADLLALCSDMGLQVVSLQRLPADRRSPVPEEAPSRSGGEPGRPTLHRHGSRGAADREREEAT